MSRAGLGGYTRSTCEGFSGAHYPECLSFRVIPALPHLACLASHFQPIQSPLHTAVLSLVWLLILGLCVPSSLHVTRSSREEILACPGWPSHLPHPHPPPILFQPCLLGEGSTQKPDLSSLQPLSPLSQFPPGLKEAKENRGFSSSLCSSPLLPAPGRWFALSPALAEPGLGVWFL